MYLSQAASSFLADLVWLFPTLNSFLIGSAPYTHHQPTSGLTITSTGREVGVGGGEGLNIRLMVQGFLDLILLRDGSHISLQTETIQVWSKWRISLLEPPRVSTVMHWTLSTAQLLV